MKESGPLMEGSLAPGTITIDGGEFGDDASGGIFASSKSGWIDLQKTVEVQSRWNSHAAWFSAATALATASAEIAKKYCL
jgi:hypothetical protein